MLVVDYECEFLQLSKHALELVPTEEESCKRFLREMRDDLWVQLISHKIKKFPDLVERAKTVEQALGLDKKGESSQVFGKRV